ncbi:MAG: hypothetical protein FWH12_02385 [Treponema sp.]|nr:hypothetical protein [Treponema sp.]
MFNIAVTKENQTRFYEDADGKPRQYPTLADALVTAQYHGLTKESDGLFFVKHGTPVDDILRPAPKGGAGGDAAAPKGGDSGAGGGNGGPSAGEGNGGNATPKVTPPAPSDK